MERGAELERRAEELRERDKRRRQAQKRREQQEEREREVRRKMGVGLATQLAGFSHTQKRMKGAMESFLGVRKREQGKCALPGLDTTIEEARPDPQRDGGEPGNQDLFMEDDLLLADLLHAEAAAAPAFAHPRHNDQHAESAPHVTMDVAQICATRPSEAAPINRPPTTLVESPVGADVQPADAKTQSREPTGIMPALVSLECNWEQFVASGTQLTRELNGIDNPTSPCRSTSGIGLVDDVDALFASEDLLPDGLDSPGNIKAATVRTNHNTAGPDVVRDLAYPMSFSQPCVSPMPLKKQSIANTSPSQSRFIALGLSTQLLHDAFDDDDDADAIEQSSPLTILHGHSGGQGTSTITPPRRIRNFPPVFKPPDALEPLPGSHCSSFEHFGLSTQLLHDVVDEELEFSPVDTRTSSSSFGGHDLDDISWTQLGA
jgi:hypothetical protein